VNQPVEDPIGHCGIADLLMPSRHRHLWSHAYAQSLTTLFANFPEISTFGFGERRHRPVVDDQHCNAADPRKEMAETSIGACQGELAK